MLVTVPSEIRSDLGERYRQLRPFDEAEMDLARALVKRPSRLPRPQEVVMRQALNLARLWVIGQGSEPLVVGPRLTAFRERLVPVAKQIVDAGALFDPLTLSSVASDLAPRLIAERDAILAQHQDHLNPSTLDRELSKKALVLALGGGGGSGYVHLGAFTALEALGLSPQMIAGTSMGAILGRSSDGVLDAWYGAQVRWRSSRGKRSPRSRSGFRGPASRRTRERDNGSSKFVTFGTL